jgi:F-type H+-transporting ATPase subunit epsilon
MLHFSLITPERILFQEEAVSVTLPTADGEITVLPNHAPLVAALVPGVAALVRADGLAEDMAVSGGFIKIERGSKVTVLADTAERGQELSLNVIREAKERADAVMKRAVTRDDAAYALAAASLERELARERAAIRHARRKGLPMADHSSISSRDNVG